MSRRTLLPFEQRARLFGIPTEAAEMATHYVLNSEDLTLVCAKRRPSNRLGFAVQLCVFRHPGRPLDLSEMPPAPMLAFVANQLRIDPMRFAEYAHRAETRREHLLELQRALCLRSFRLSDWGQVTKVHFMPLSCERTGNGTTERELRRGLLRTEPDTAPFFRLSPALRPHERSGHWQASLWRA